MGSGTCLFGILYWQQGLLFRISRKIFLTAGKDSCAPESIENIDFLFQIIQNNTFETRIKPGSIFQPAFRKRKKVVSPFIFFQ